MTGRGAECDSSMKRDLACLCSSPDASKRDLAGLQKHFIGKLEGVQRWLVSGFFTYFFTLDVFKILHLRRGKSHRAVNIS